MKKPETRNPELGTRSKAPRYRAAGVDIETADRFVRAIRPLVRTTFRPEVLTDIGSFGGLFKPRFRRFESPVLVAGTDGVGTKLKVAFLTGRHDTVGVDLVAMCVNDILVHGAEPLFFLDYLATGKLRPRQALQVVKGIVRGCREAGCALLGGETAEMPSFYAQGEYELAGFAVGVVERRRIVDGSGIRPGDQILGLASSGLHSNGYSLARKVLLEEAGLGLRQRIKGLRRSLGQELLVPTRIYAKPVLSLLRQDIPLRGMAHITGGGITENLPRVLPPGCRAQVRLGSWPVPTIFQLIQGLGRVKEAEMRRAFNMGIGLILVVRKTHVQRVLRTLAAMGERAFVLGEIVKGRRGVRYVRT